MFRVILASSILLSGIHVNAGTQLSTPIEVAVRRAALKHHIDASLYMGILKHESKLQLSAVNARTHDFGIAQINRSTARRYNLSTHRLTTDLAYSLDSGALILADFKQQYAAREPATWVCHYNLGTGRLTGARAEICIKYLNNVNKGIL